MNKKLPDEIMGYDDTLQLFDAFRAVSEIFDDNEKTAVWFTTGNPHLGGAIPMRLFLVGRGHKVLKFILAAKEENWP
jgi:hypothetical protein